MSTKPKTSTPSMLIPPRPFLFDSIIFLKHGHKQRLKPEKGSGNRNVKVSQKKQSQNNYDYDLYKTAVSLRPPFHRLILAYFL